MKTRLILNQNSPEEIKQAYRNLFEYNPNTGEIKNKITGKVYDKLTKKGYGTYIYYQKNKVEYKILYHRLCWFLYYNELLDADVQIDHINNIRNDNRLINLRITDNYSNNLKKLNYTNSNSIYKGVCKVKDKNQYGKIYIYYSCTITYEKKTYKIGRFKNEILSAIFYDAANRYYFKNYSLTNFNKEYLKPMSIKELRLLKKNKQKIKELNDAIFKDFQ